MNLARGSLILLGVALSCRGPAPESPAPPDGKERLALPTPGEPRASVRQEFPLLIESIEPVHRPPVVPWTALRPATPVSTKQAPVVSEVDSGGRSPDPLDEPPPDTAAPPTSRPPTSLSLASSPPPPGVASRMVDLPLRAWSEHFLLYTQLDLPHERLVTLAERTRDRTRRWLGAATSRGAPGRGRVQILLCETPEQMREIEVELRLPPWRNPGLFGGGAATGGYFHAERTVLLQFFEGRNMDWFVSHEVCHSVFREEARAHPVVINEGLAELLPSWILYCDSLGPENCTATYPEYTAHLARSGLADDPPGLREMLAMTRPTFQSDRWTNFALAWSLLKLLIESDHPELRGRVPRLIYTLGASGDPWEDFNRVYDGRQVERLWHESLAALGR